MSSRAEIFLEGWVAEFVKPRGHTDVLAEAHRIASRCLADASDEGISHEEILESVGGDLAGYIFCFIAETAD